jgi:integrase
MKGDIISKHSVSLTKDEVQAIIDLQLPRESKLNHVRNMMVLALNLGIRHSEYLLIDPTLWREPSQLITSPKTGKTCLLVHRPQVRVILKQYEHCGLPKSLKTNQHINREIKEICKLAGLNRMVNKTITRDGVDYHKPLELYNTVSTHTLRRTKITLDLNAGRSLRDICLETGQDEATARKHYDRPNLEEHVRNLGIKKVQSTPD